MSKDNAAVRFTNPVLISSLVPRQFRITNARDTFTISVSDPVTGISSTNPLSIGPPTRFESAVQFASTRSRQLSLTTRDTTQYANAPSPQVIILPATIGAIAHITDSVGLVDGFEIRLPASSQVAAQIRAVSGLAVALSDTIDTIITNDTPKTARITLADAVNDTMSPLDGSGEILVAARSQLVITCVFVSISTLTTRANYLVGRYGASGSSGGGMSIHANVAAFPPIGNPALIYVAADTNRIYRYQSGIIASGYDWVIGPGGDFSTPQAALASASVQDGDKLYILNGIYSIPSTLTISKQVQIFGQCCADVILQSLGTATDPVTLVSVTVGNVVIRGLTLRHQKTTNTTVETALVVSGPGLTRVPSFIIDDCRIEYVEFAIQIRGDSWKIAGTTLSYVGPSNSTRAIGVLGINGNCFITGNVFMSNNAGGTHRATTPMVAIGTDTYVGTLAIEDNTQSGPLAQLFIQDSFLGVPGGYNVMFKRNTTSETSVFASFFVSVPNDADILGHVTAQDNHLANASGKGVITADGAAASFRTSALPIHVDGNVLVNPLIAPTYTLAIGASDAACAYANTLGAPVFVNQDAIIPATPAAPITPSIWTVADGYWEMSTAPITRKDVQTVLSPEDQVYMDLNHIILPNSLVLFKNRQGLIEGIDYVLSIVGSVSRLTWVNTIAPGGTEQLVIGDRISSTYWSD